MTLHQFTCTECPTQPFYTLFEPMYDPPATCPCCGESKNVSYQNTVVVKEVVKNAPIAKTA